MVAFRKPFSPSSTIAWPGLGHFLSQNRSRRRKIRGIREEKEIEEEEEEEEEKETQFFTDQT